MCAAPLVLLVKPSPPESAVPRYRFQCAARRVPGHRPCFPSFPSSCRRCRVQRRRQLQCGRASQFCFEVAARIGKGRVSEEEIEAARIHGADEAIASGLSPTAPISSTRPPGTRCRLHRRIPEARASRSEGRRRRAVGETGEQRGEHRYFKQACPSGRSRRVIVSTEESRQRRRAETLDAFAPVIIMDSSAAAHESDAAQVTEDMALRGR